MTAVEFLEKICNDRGYHLMEEYFEQAKEMEKQQMKDAYKFGIQDDYVIGAEHYYNETFKKT